MGREAALRGFTQGHKREDFAAAVEARLAAYDAEDVAAMARQGKVDELMARDLAEKLTSISAAVDGSLAAAGSAASYVFDFGKHEGEVRCGALRCGVVLCTGR